MRTIVNYLTAVLLFTSSILALWSCSPKADPVALTLDQRNEQSASPAVRLSGNYTCIRLQLENGYLESRSQIKGNGYAVSVQAKGDSVQLSLSGDGTAGRFAQLDLGTYAVEYKTTVGAGAGYFTVKKDILDGFSAVTVIDRTVVGTAARQIIYSFPITLYQFLPGTPNTGQFTPVKASDIFSTTQRIVGIFTVERVLSLPN
ncbi:MAG: hypothetical protein LH609_13520 [Rudanella sp.]|nr:hypothetical protein [Rudanella sp.]